MIRRAPSGPEDKGSRRDPRRREPTPELTTPRASRAGTACRTTACRTRPARSTGTICSLARRSNRRILESMWICRSASRCGAGREPERLSTFLADRREKRVVGDESAPCGWPLGPSSDDHARTQSARAIRVSWQTENRARIVVVRGRCPISSRRAALDQRMEPAALHATHTANGSIVAMSSDDNRRYWQRAPGSRALDRFRDDF